MTGTDPTARLLAILSLIVAFFSLMVTIANAAWQFIKWRQEEGWVEVELGELQRGLDASSSTLQVNVTNRSAKEIYIRSVGLRMPAGIIRHRLTSSPKDRRYNLYRPVEDSDVREIKPRRSEAWQVAASRLKAFSSSKSLRAVVELEDGRRRFSSRQRLPS